MEAGVAGLHFPMYVVRMQDLLEMTEVAPHNELLAQGKLHKYEPGMGAVVFVSHQWCGKKHPDPDFKQFKVFQSALRNFFAGSITVEWDFQNKAFAGATDTLTAVEIDDMLNSYVWFDYFAIPQLNARSVSVTAQMQADTQAAVDSIPSYVEFSKYFMVLSPTVMHADHPDEKLNYLSWCSRGWCRLERAARMLSPQQDNRMILVQSDTCMKFVGAQDYLHAPPGMGDFAYESDREPVVKVMAGMVSKKLQAHLLSGELHKYRVLLSLRRSLLSSMSPDICQDSGICRGFNDFLKQYQFDSPTIKDSHGWTPMHYATIEGNVSVMQDLIEHGADIHSATTENDTDFFCIPGSTPIAWASRWGGRETIEFLLDSGAKLNEPCQSYGVKPIILAAWSNNFEAVDTFIDRKAQIHSRTALNTSAIEAAIMNSHNDMVIKLIEAGVTVEPAAIENKSPLFCLALFNHSDNLVQHLIAAKCNPDEKIQIDPSQKFSCALAAGASAYALGDRDDLAVVGHHEQP